MKTYAFKCRWCGAAGTVAGSEEYEAAGFDPQRLLRYCCCASCSKRGRERERLESAIYGLCVNLCGQPGRALSKMVDRYGPELRELLKEYWAMIGRHVSIELTDFPEDFLQKIIAAPRNAPLVFNEMWKAAKESQAQAKLL